MLDDLRLAARSLRAHPGAFLLALACLGVGVGVNVAFFGLLDALLLGAPTGVAGPDELVRVRVGAEAGPVARGAGSTASYPQYERIAGERSDWLALAAYGRGGATLGDGAEARAVPVLVVTANYFDVLGVTPRLGRFFRAVEGAPEAGIPVAVLSHALWERRFGADPGVLGQQLMVNGVPVTVIGVASRGFVGVDLADPGLWIPIGLAGRPEVGPGYGPGAGWMQMFGRLRAGLTLEAALGVTRSAPADPYATADEEPLPVHLLPLRTTFFGDQRGQNPVPVWALGLSLAALLLACVTVANLLLARAVRRRRHTAVRLALGGSPARIVREQLLEGALLALAAVACGALLAWVSLGLLERLPIPPVQTVVTGRSLAVGFGLGALTPLAFALAPAVWSLRREVGEALREGDRGAPSALRMQHGLLTGQLSITFALLLLAGLFVRSFAGVRSIDTGIDTGRILEVSTGPRTFDPQTTGADRLAPLLERIRRLPGVEAAAVGSIVPYYLTATASFEIADGRPEAEQPRSESVVMIGSGYLRTLGIELVAGREIGDADRMGAPPVAVVSESLARTYWRGTSPLGSCVRISAGLVGGSFAGACAEVVGVARDASYRDPLSSEPTPTLYLSAAQTPERFVGLTLFVRTVGDPASLVPDVTREASAFGADMASVRIEPLAVRLRPARIQWEVASRLFAALGGLGALLAGIGLYVVVEFIVSQRARELAVRVAMGARGSDLVRLVLVRGLTTSAAGIVLGILVSLGLARFFRSRLFGLAYTDIPTYVGVAAALALVTLLAGLRPALGATRSDPVVALRADS